jgi:hypothetical protein
MARTKEQRTTLESSSTPNHSERSFLWHTEHPPGYVPEKFDLIFPFERIFPLLVEKYATLPEKERRKKIKKDLSDILASQYEDWLREELRMPIYDQRFLQVEVDEYGKCSLWNRKLYPHGDILHQCRLAVEQAVQDAQRERYQAELEQTEMLVAAMQTYMDKVPQAIVKFLAEAPDAMKESPPPSWLPYTGKLPEDLLVARPREKETQPAFVGEKQLFVLPQNLEVYPDGSAFWAVWQLAYIPWLPEGKKYVVLIQQYMHFLPMGDDAAMMKKVGIPDVAPTEQELMSHSTALGFEYRQLDAVHTFAGLLGETGKDLSDTGVAADYQTSIGKFESYAQTLPAASEFLAEVFLNEFDRLQRLWKQGLHEPLPAEALKAAHAIVMNTFIQKRPFNLEDSMATYTQTYQPASRGPYTSAQDYAQLQSNFIQGLSQTESMWHVINRVSSVTQCAAGSFGGLSRIAEMANNASFMQGLGLPGMSPAELMNAIQDRSHEFSRDQIAEFIGKERFDANFSKGTCIHCGHEDWIGECKVCWRCELSWDAKNLGERYAKEGTNDTNNSAVTPPQYEGRAGAGEFVQLLGGHRPEYVFATPYLSHLSGFEKHPPNIL